MKKWHFRLGPRAFVSLLSITAPAANALEGSVQVGYVAEYSNNVGLTADNEDGAWIQTPQILLNASHDGATTTAAVEYNLAREMYEGNAFDDLTTATGNAEFKWMAIPDRLSFD